MTGSSCSQTWTGIQPDSCSWRSLRLSRATLPLSFNSHHSALFFGAEPCTGQRCQKHPSTNIATRARVRTMSGVPGSCRRCTRNRSPRRCISRLSASSTPVSPRGIDFICRCTASFNGTGGEPRILRRLETTCLPSVRRRLHTDYGSQDPAVGTPYENVTLKGSFTPSYQTCHPRKLDNKIFPRTVIRQTRTYTNELLWRQGNSITL